MIEENFKEIQKEKVLKATEILHDSLHLGMYYDFYTPRAETEIARGILKILFWFLIYRHYIHFKHWMNINIRFRWINFKSYIKNKLYRNSRIYRKYKGYEL